MKKQKGAVNITLKIILFIVLAAYSVSLLFPLAWGLLTSFKSSLDFDTLRNVMGLPDMEFSRDEVLKFSNYASMFKDIRLARSVSFFMGNTEITHNSINGLGGMIINSLVYALGGAFLNTAVTMCVAYVCAKYKFKAAGIIYALVLFSMAFSPAGIYPATISLLRGLGIYDTWFGYFFMKFNFGGMYFLLFYSFYQMLSDTYRYLYRSRADRRRVAVQNYVFYNNSAFGNHILYYRASDFRAALERLSNPAFVYAHKTHACVRYLFLYE